MKALVNLARKRSERVFLVGVELKSRDRAELRESLDELAELAQTAGAEVVGDGIQKMESLNAATFIGKGKAEEFSKFCKANDVDTVIFDDELSPAQSRNLEKIFDCKILDRTALILEIFGAARPHARRQDADRTRATEIFAAAPHALLVALVAPARLAPAPSAAKANRSSKPTAGKFPSALKKLKANSTTSAASARRSAPDASAATGRSPRLSATRTPENPPCSTRSPARKFWPKDKLFATLDPTTRRLRLPTNQNVLLTDTVGFIKKLPHGLVEAFKATLEEVVQADLLLHVVDISHPQAEEQIEAVNSVLKEIGAEGKPVLMVFNKMDKLNGSGAANLLQEKFPNAVGISATTGEGVSNLLAELGTQLRPTREFLELKIPHEQSAVIARLHKVGQVIERRYNGKTAKFKVRIPPQHHGEFAAVSL